MGNTLKMTVVAWTLAGLCAIGAQSQPAEAESPIDPRADVVLRQMSDHIRQTQTAIFRVTDTMDDVWPDGRKIQISHIRELTISRPDKLKVDVTGDVTNRTLWADGQQLTVLEKDKNAYAQIATSGTIAQAIDMLQEQYGMSLPAADLLSDDPYQTLTEGCERVDYIGLGYAGEEKCHHLAFVRENIDYQLWITTGDKPAARKLVITYKQLPGEPQYTLQLIKMENPEKIDAATFTGVIPKGAEKIEIQPVAIP